MHHAGGADRGGQAAGSGNHRLQVGEHSRLLPPASCGNADKG
jgi:hypothetical protein